MDLNLILKRNGRKEWLAFLQGRTPLCPYPQDLENPYAQLYFTATALEIQKWEQSTVIAITPLKIIMHDQQVKFACHDTKAGEVVYKKTFAFLWPKVSCLNSCIHCSHRNFTDGEILTLEQITDNRETPWWLIDESSPICRNILPSEETNSNLQLMQCFPTSDMCAILHFSTTCQILGSHLKSFPASLGNPLGAFPSSWSIGSVPHHCSGGFSRPLHYSLALHTGCASLSSLLSIVWSCNVNRPALIVHAPHPWLWPQVVCQRQVLKMLQPRIKHLHFHQKAT